MATVGTFESSAALYAKCHVIKAGGAEILLPVSSAKKYTVYRSTAQAYFDPAYVNSYYSNQLCTVSIGDYFVYSGKKFKKNGFEYYEMIPVKKCGSIYVVSDKAIGLTKGHFTTLSDQQVVVGCASILKANYSTNMTTYWWNGEPSGGPLPNYEVARIVNNLDTLNGTGVKASIKNMLLTAK